MDGPLSMAAFYHAVSGLTLSSPVAAGHVGTYPLLLPARAEKDPPLLGNHYVLYDTCGLA
jgi:hypothetical protein